MHRHELRYHLLDVFTREPFGGNQLAVFADAAEVPAELMPRIARELNLSETVFVLPPERGGFARLRIFTPGAELPFAGHPTVGTACLLASLGRIRLSGGRAGIVFEEGAGDVPVQVQGGAGDEVPFAQLSAPQRPEFRKPSIETVDLARVLGIEPGDILDDPAVEPAAVSCGVPFLFVALRDREAVHRCRLDMAAWAAVVATSWAPQLFVYALGAGPERPRVRSRMFAPGLGIVEDPATGSAATALAALLASRTGTDGTHRWEVEQGFEMGRPSILEIEADVRARSVTASRVGGHSVLIGDGTLRLPRGPGA